jgi:hemophore
MAFQIAKTGLFAATCALGVALSGSPAAVAAPDPCAASSIARTVGSVGTNTGIYLEAHPETNDVLTMLAAQPAGPQSIAALKLYFDRDPQAAEDLQAIQQPLTSLTTRCRLPISLPQVLGLMQAAQQGAPAAVADTGTAVGTSPVSPVGTAAGAPVHR